MVMVVMMIMMMIRNPNAYVSLYVTSFSRGYDRSSTALLTSNLAALQIVLVLIIIAVSWSDVFIFIC